MPRCRSHAPRINLINGSAPPITRTLRLRSSPCTVKSLESFDFTAIPSLNKTLVLELARSEYVAGRENVIAVGNSGTDVNQQTLNVSSSITST